LPLCCPVSATIAWATAIVPRRSFSMPKRNDENTSSNERRHFHEKQPARESPALSPDRIPSIAASVRWRSRRARAALNSFEDSHRFVLTPQARCEDRILQCCPPPNRHT
jgi:hypothetical protein